MMHLNHPLFDRSQFIDYFDKDICSSLLVPTSKFIQEIVGCRGQIIIVQTSSHFKRRHTVPSNLNGF